MRPLALLAALALLLLLAGLSTATPETPAAEAPVAPEYHQYLIVGAGPGGLQLAAHLAAEERDFVILEKSSEPGSFFSRFPRHGQLISINKRFTGREDPEFNLRHDWNSLLPGRDGDTSSPLMGAFSKKFFPQREEFSAYVRAYVEHHGLEIQYGREVVRVTKEGQWEGTGPDHQPLFQLQDAQGKRWSCLVLIMATAQSRPYIPTEIPGIELAVGYEDLEDPRADPEAWTAAHENKRILVLGLGNSAFETAAAFSPIAAHVHVVGRSTGGLRQAYNTHYVGDLRVVNDHILDTFLLKSLDTVDVGFDLREGALRRNETDGRVYLITDASAGNQTNFNYREGYDLVVRCLGWRFDASMFDPKTAELEISASGKFPVQNIDFESMSVPNLFFAGNLMHFQDFKESAGGFIHGFRYLVRNLARRFGQRYHGESLFRSEEPDISGTPEGIARALLDRIQSSSGLYQMFGQLADVLVWDQRFGDGTRADYVEELVLKGVTQQESHPDTLMWSLHFDYGKALDGRADNSLVVLHPGQAHRSQFLHPILRFYRPPAAGKGEDGADGGYFSQLAEFHIMEDFLVGWDVEELHVQPLVKWIERCIAGDYTSQEELLQRRSEELRAGLSEAQRAQDIVITDPFYGEFTFPRETAAGAEESELQDKLLRSAEALNAAKLAAGAAAMGKQEL